ncbi:protein GRAVITROPIC IN THE LIGHT 1-like [Salvia hispanica]|uniref:protein GRAVITROPIC IN THE LIGHT 1-like n=1 Tax=Salvia hispanica TaxID=49212 RepID=UPI002009321E|nr:protein GRAVITROPIC IN THE LIGHT 1-like [Salvia hispanica]XP_047955801.1 protein GRAVITROPIC IN THE LIGHT 1-like [Salvia hispanica]XP_047955810.1 protein GRAVITROPIC IN THE LIGHT 1-like [Salvia hispanica]XP_047955818.1 protein GRAVITROPIC IN THE LIGHT 1-like [Salvia hispanica]XP_047955825.1 protein GRAVITROPIC IN THE LIGHT 1-like [Salvia hispanica]
MDSVERSPRKSRLARAIAKVLHVRAVTGVAPDDGGIRKAKSRDKAEKDGFEAQTFRDRDEEELRHDGRMVQEAFLSKLFASVSAVKAAYAEMQFAQSPPDADGIQAADEMVISELKRLSELKQAYLKKQLNEASPGTTLLLSEIREQRSTLKMYEVTAKKLDSLLKHRDSETASLKKKLSEANKANKLLETRLSSSGQFFSPETRVGNFVSSHRETLKSIRAFVRLLITEMVSAGWDLDAAAEVIEPDARFRNPSHKCFAFESFVCEKMFDGFNRPNSSFAAFCRAKYLRLVHPKMEASLFGSLDQRDSVESGGLPDTPFFAAFSEMAKRVWLLHRLALSSEPEISAFQVRKGSRFSEVYMESLSDDAMLLPEPLVALSVAPGFRIGKSVVQCQVYLC